MSNEGSSNGIVQELLNKDNYNKWRSLVKNYLISQDLWDVASTKPNEYVTAPGEDSFDEKKNAKALHAIMSSCGSEALWVIAHIEKACDAWIALEHKFVTLYYRDPVDLQDVSSNTNILYDKIHKALISGDWSRVRPLLDELQLDPILAVTTIINIHEENSLHVAACYGHKHLIEELIREIPNPAEILERPQKVGHTVLSLAIEAGNIDMVKYLVEKNNRLPRVKSAHNGMLPIQLALYVGQIDLARYLYGLTYVEDLIENDCFHGVPVLCLFILSKNFDIARDLVFRCPKLILYQSKDGMICPTVLAMCKSAFPSGTRLGFLQRRIYNRIEPPSSALRPSTVRTNEHGESNSLATNDTQNNSIGGEWYQNPPNRKCLLYRIGSCFYEFFGFKKMYELKLMHTQSKEFLQETLVHLGKFIQRKRKLVDIAQCAMIKAVEEGNVEFVIALSKVIPEMIRDIDHRKRTLFSYAVECRQAEIFSLVHGCSILKHEIAPLVDDQGDTVLHMAGKLAPPSHLSRISGAALQMQRELQWFKEVESTILEHNTVVKDYFKNWKCMTARQYFTENHKQLAIDGEKWMKATATSCIFVSALIVTIMFAAAFVVPGGTEGDGTRSLRVISHQRWFLLYIIFDAISLFSSTTSVLMFLGILTSRYNEDAFLKALPTKLILGLSTLFFSIAAMMIAFCASLYMMLQGRLFILIPIVLLACVPVALFVKLQYPVLAEIWTSTYGRGIFTRKYDNWLLDVEESPASATTPTTHIERGTADRESNNSFVVAVTDNCN